MRRTISFLLLTSLLCACGGGTESFNTLSHSRTSTTVVTQKEGFSNDPGELPPPPNPTARPGAGRRLLALYMVGSDLESDGDFGTADLLELAAGYTSLLAAEQNRLSILVAFGGADQDGWRGMKILDIDQLVADAADGTFGNEPQGAYLLVAEGANMGHPDSLEFFLRVLAAGFPNHDNRFVLFWDHGASYQGFGNDGNFNFRPLELSEMDAAFTDSGLGRVDLIGFDACLMASLEVARRFKNHASLLVASEEVEPGHGWSYRNLVTSLATTPNMITYARGLVDNFVDSSNHPTVSQGKTLSVLDLSKMEELQAALDAAMQPYTASILTDMSFCFSFVQAVVTSRAYEARLSIDLRDFARIAQELAPDAPTAELLDRLLTAIDSAVVYSDHDGSRSGSNGISIVPPDAQGAELSNSRQATPGWARLVNASTNKRNADRTPPTLTSLISAAGGITA